MHHRSEYESSGFKVACLAEHVTTWEKYTITIEAAVPFNTTPGTHASVPADITQRLVSQDTVLYAGFLLAYLPQLKTTAGLHWTTQPAARGRITLYSNADGYQKI